MALKYSSMLILSILMTFIGNWWYITSASCIDIGDHGCITNTDCCETHANIKTLKCNKNNHQCIDSSNNGDNSFINYEELDDESIFSKFNKMDANGNFTLILIAIFLLLILLIISCWTYMYCTEKKKEDENDDLSTLSHVVDWKTVVNEIKNGNQSNDEHVQLYYE
eukprot:75106_1